MLRKPFALTNWKMAMTIAESLTFVEDFSELAGDLFDTVDVVVCPPFTALWAVSQALKERESKGQPCFQLGIQNISATTDLARTGEISATLAADVGCKWAMLGHWEVRRHLHDDDEQINQKIHLAWEVGLIPVVLIGESRLHNRPLDVLMGRVLAGCQPEQIVRTAFIYEQERAIGGSEPTPLGQVTAGCKFIRDWISERWGESVAEQVRIIYGGSVTPEHAPELLSCSDVDGLGAGRKGRQAESFMNIIRQIAKITEIR
jgi:triosephosphate isomerase